MARPARAFELLRAHGDGGDSWAVLREVRRKTRRIRAFAFARRPGILAPSLALALRAAAARPGLDPGAFAFAILQTQSRSDIWDSVTYAFGCRRAGSRFRGDDDKKGGSCFSCRVFTNVRLGMARSFPHEVATPETTCPLLKPANG